MPSRSQLVAFDALGTTFSLDALKPRLEAAGLPGHLAPTWIARILRDAFALAAAGGFAPFRELARGNLETLFAEHGGKAASLETILDGFSELDAEPDARAAFELVRGQGRRTMVLTNGGPAATARLLERNQLAALTDLMVSVEEAGTYKPRIEVYHLAASRAGLVPGALALVSAHPWDVHGAKRAGLAAAYVARGRPYPSAMERPDATGETLEAAVAALLRAG